ncbi:hypothetical protein [uncultured Clostridium sp.]|jgi:hypothetical protein|uniref:hypothetical protein n=1 Tax=uncultured Clostridium sp. TaxID=59620 RepID=UPI00272B4ABC|nr:hypothetical protein [uncultured Clostridium sp.]
MPFITYWKALKNRIVVGSINNFLKIRKQMQERRKKLQRELTLTNGGKGRDKKHKHYKN